MSGIRVDARRAATSAGVTRRALLVGGAAVALGGRAAFAADPGEPGEAPTPAQALATLVAGNQRYFTGKTTPRDFSLDRQKLESGQRPIAAVLACSDSRVVPEFAFDLGRGELFVVRVAGNAVSDDGVASLEYAVQYLGVPLVLVLGHSSCGAIKSAIAVLDEGAQLPGKLPELIAELKPAVQQARQLPGDLLANAIRTNVALQVEDLKARDPVLAPRIKDGKAGVVGAVYDLSTGRVEILT